MLQMQQLRPSSRNKLDYKFDIFSALQQQDVPTATTYKFLGLNFRGLNGV